MVTLTLALIVASGLLAARIATARTQTPGTIDPVATPLAALTAAKPIKRSVFGSRVGLGFLSRRGDALAVAQRNQILKLTDEVSLLRQRSARGGISLSLNRQIPLPKSAPQGADAKDLYYFDSWIPHPGTDLTPQSILAAFRQAELGYPRLMCDLIDDLVEGDAHVRNLFEHRERVAAKADLEIGAGAGDPDSEASACALSTAFERLAWKGAAEQLARVHRYGFSGVELDWSNTLVDGREWIVPTCLTVVPPRRFTIGTLGMIPIAKYPDGTPTAEAGKAIVRFDELRLYMDLGVPQGHPLRDGKWIALRRQTSQVARGGLGRTAALLMMAKRFSLRDWLIFAERYGIPWPVASYREGSADSLIEIAKQIVANIGNDGGAAVPEGMTLDIKDGVKGDHPVQQVLSAWCNNELSKLVNGSTLRNDSTGSGGSSYGLGNVHDQVAWDEVQADGELLSEALVQQVVIPFMRFNGLKCAQPKVTINVTPDMGPAQFIDGAVKMTNELGVKVSQTQLRETTGYRAPLNKEDEAPGMTVQKFPAPAGGTPK